MATVQMPYLAQFARGRRVWRLDGPVERRKNPMENESVAGGNGSGRGGGGHSFGLVWYHLQRDAPPVSWRERSRYSLHRYSLLCGYVNVNGRALIN